jgi:dethiobiotin synthetase/adenosylmethionine--8-amino-7-oxononanoate aminotransferase
MHKQVDAAAWSLSCPCFLQLPPPAMPCGLQVEALLHGHSYTAYPLGCAAAMASLAILQNHALNPNLCTPAAPGRCQKALASNTSSSNEAGTAAECTAAQVCSCSKPCGQLLPQWDDAAAAELSHHPRVKGVVVLGSVLAVELAAVGADGQPVSEGYGSSAAVDVVTALRARGVAARPLGPVVYCMLTPTTDRAVGVWWLQQLRQVLDLEGVWGASGSDGVIV